MIAIQPSFSASPVSNEDDTASITAVIGSVVDVLKLPIARTTVTLTIPGTDQVAKEVWADENGNFIIKVPAKRYVIRLVTPGFRARATRLENPTAWAILDIGMVVLQIGEITEGPLFPAKASGVKSPQSPRRRLATSPVTPSDSTGRWLGSKAESALPFRILSFSYRTVTGRPSTGFGLNTVVVPSASQSRGVAATAFLETL
jgi:hypothetical protein